MRAAGLRCGLALSPGTPVEAVYPLCDAGGADLVLVMTVSPGFGGQAFQPEQLHKVAALRKRYPALDVQVDGGVNASTARAAAEAGANVLVAGSAVFGSAEPARVVAELRSAMQEQSWAE